MNNAVSAGGGKYGAQASAAITIASTGYSVAKGVGEINDLKDYLQQFSTSTTRRE